MTPPRSLRSELIRAFWIFGGLLVVVFGLIVVAGSIEQEDLTLMRQLSFELDQYLEQNLDAVAGTGSAPPPVTSRFIRAHLGTETLPEALRELAATLADGIHEIEKGALEGEDYFVAVRSLPDRPERLYLVYDARQLDEWVEFGRPSFRVVVGGGTVVVLLGLITASRMSRRVLEPVAELERAVSLHTEPRSLARALAERADPPELASLSSALQRSMRRLDAFIERERHFTRAASHELRTPVTVIRGAAELLEQGRYRATLDREKAARLVGRIRRAVDQMEDLIEAFLWMAREDQAAATSWSTDLDAIVHDVVEQHRPLLAGRQVSIELDLEPSPPVAAPPQAASVVLSNLVKNALDSTRSGRVRVEATAGRVRVVNSGPALGGRPGAENGKPGGATAQAHGFGLAIVHELCDRFGWRSTLTTDPDGATVATVDFTPE